MERIKKIILYLAGPVVLFVELVALFIHLFTSIDTKTWMIAGFVVFMIGFVPLYSVEYFRQNYKKDKTKKSASFKKTIHAPSGKVVIFMVKYPPRSVVPENFSISKS